MGLVTVDADPDPDPNTGAFLLDPKIGSLSTFSDVDVLPLSVVAVGF